MDVVVAPPSLRAVLPARVDAWTAATAAMLAAIVALATVLRASAVTRQGLWYDEAMTAWLVREMPGQLLAALPHTESTPPLYYLIAWGWVRVFGDSEAGLRSLSVVAGVATVPVAFAAARQLGARRAGLVAALLVAANPLLVWYSQEARAYSLFALATGMSFWLFTRARAEPTPRRLVAWALVSAAALCTHYFAAFAVAPEALGLLASRQARLRWRVAAVGIVGAAAAPLAALAWTQRSHARWQGVFSLRLRAEQLPTQLLAGFAPPATAPALAVIASAVLVVLVVALRGAHAELRGARVAIAVVGVVIAVPVGLAAVGIDYLNTRNAIAAVVPLMVALGLCAGSRRAGIAGLAAAFVIAAVSTALVAAVPREPAAQRPHWRAVAAALAVPRGVRRAILIHGSSSWALPLGFYLPHTWWAGPQGVRASEIDVLSRLPEQVRCTGRSWWGATCSIRSRRPLPGPPARGFRFVSERRVAGFRITRYRAPRPIRLFQRPPLEVPRPPHPGWDKHKLLFSPEAVPLIP